MTYTLCGVGSYEMKLLFYIYSPLLPVFFHCLVRQIVKSREEQVFILYFICVCMCVCISMYVYKVCYNIESMSLFVEYLESALSGRILWEVVLIICLLDNSVAIWGTVQLVQSKPLGGMALQAIVLDLDKNIY